jgi:hypothetical protein
VSDVLRVLRRLLAFARANVLVPPGFNPTGGLEAPTPDSVAERTRQPTYQRRPTYSFTVCGNVPAQISKLRVNCTPCGKSQIT